MKNRGEIVIFKTEDNQIQIDVRLEEETVWLTQNQMVSLFNSSKANISEHIKFIYQEGELEKNSTVRKFRTVKIEGRRKVTRELDYYNLDVIISVGYRVKSKRGTQFRIWANRVLKDYLLKGYALNERLLQKQNEKLNLLNNAIKMISSISTDKYLYDESKDSFILLLEKYSTALSILDDYDYNRIKEIEVISKSVHKLKYIEVRKIIDKMKVSIGNSKYFGKEKDESLKSSISTIYQTFGGKDLYPSLEEKAANLLYFIVKNHSFIDGNKRIAAAIFLYFLDKNKLLGKMNFNNNFFVALTLMIANSKPSDKNLIVNIVSVLLQGSQ